MRTFVMILLSGSLIFLTACNDEDNINNTPSSPKPNPTQPNCKMHCAP